MDFEALKMEAENLGRPGDLLVPEAAGKPVAWDYGYSVGKPSVALSRAGRVVVVVPNGRGGGLVSEADKAPAGGTALYPVPCKSFPPIEAVFLFGSDAVGNWLAANNWDRSWGYNDNFNGRQVVGEYEDWWQSQHPFYIGGAAAIRGGWHFVWPDDDWHDLVDQELVLWTLVGEPWLELWSSKSDLRVIERVT